MELLRWLFGGQIRRTIEVFRPNAEASAKRDYQAFQTAMAEFSSEFAQQRTGRFDRFVDGLNRLPRPLITFLVFGLFIFAAIDPTDFARRMEALTLVPEQLWQLMQVIIMFYFGARELAHFRSSSMRKEVVRIRDAVSHLTPRVADTGTDSELALETIQKDDNAAVRDYYDQGPN